MTTNPATKVAEPILTDERALFESCVKANFGCSEFSFARAYEQGYYNTVHSDTFGGRKQAEYAPVSMLWDVWQARAALGRAVARSDALTAHSPAAKCEPNIYSSRVCERGARSCNVHHPAQPAPASGAPSDAADGAGINQAIYKLMNEHFNYGAVYGEDAGQYYATAGEIAEFACAVTAASGSAQPALQKAEWIIKQIAGLERNMYSGSTAVFLARQYIGHEGLATQAATVTGDDPIGDMQAESRQAKLDDFVLATKVTGAQARASEDAARLEFLMEHEAWIARSKDGESCRLFHRSDDGEPMPMLGWGARHWSHDPREAIDAAIKAMSPGEKP